MASYFEHSRLLWKPEHPEYTNVERFRKMVNRDRGLNLRKLDILFALNETLMRVLIEDWHDLYRYSIENYDFWVDLWKFLRIIYSVPPEKVAWSPSFDPNRWTKNLWVDHVPRSHS